MKENTNLTLGEKQKKKRYHPFVDSVDGEGSLVFSLHVCLFLSLFFCPTPSQREIQFPVTLPLPTHEMSLLEVTFKGQLSVTFRLKFTFTKGLKC